MRLTSALEDDHTNHVSENNRGVPLLRTRRKGSGLAAQDQSAQAVLWLAGEKHTQGVFISMEGGIGNASQAVELVRLAQFEGFGQDITGRLELLASNVVLASGPELQRTKRR